MGHLTPSPLILDGKEHTWSPPRGLPVQDVTVQLSYRSVVESLAGMVLRHRRLSSSCGVAYHA